MVAPAPSSRTSAVFGPLHTPVTVAPKCLASWTAVAPTAPDAPLISTACPRCTPALSRRKHRAVASARAAASAWVAPAGLGATAASSDRQTYSACAPNRGAVVPKTSSPAGEARDVRPDGFDLPGEVGAQTGEPRPAQAEMGSRVVRGALADRKHTSELQSPVHLVCRLLLEK